MTRKDYILIAETLKNEIIELDDKSHKYLSGDPAAFAYLKEAHGVRSVAVRFADMLERDNPRFNREHFLAVVRGEKD